MNDIHDIKDILFVTILSQDVIITLLIGTLAFCIFLALVEGWKQFKKYRAKKTEKKTLRETFIEKIDELDIADPDYFKKLSFYIRRYFEVAGEIRKGTKKTALEIKEEATKERVYKCIDTCNLYEYTLKKATSTEKERLRTEAKEIILS